LKKDSTTPYRTPPIFWLTLLYVFGLILGSFSSLQIYPILITIFAVLLILIFGHLKSSKFEKALALLLFLLLGLFLFTFNVKRVENGQLVQCAKDKKMVIAKGVIVGDSLSKGDKIVFDLKINEINDGKKIFSVSEKTRVNVQRGYDLKIKLGQSVLIEGTPYMPSNIDSFDYKKYLLRKRVGTLFSVYPKGITICGENKTYIAALREKLKAQAEEALSLEQSVLLNGILLGDRSGISDVVNDDFAKAGVAHLLAVSGLHVGIVAGIVFLLFSRVSLPVRSIFAIAAVIFYAILVGNQPSVLRASIMLIIGYFGWLLAKEKDILSAISAAALILLVYDPFMIYSVGFQLSFLATLGIIFITPIIQSVLNSPFKKLNMAISVTLGAQLGVVPISVYYFQRLPLMTTISNLVVTPFLAPTFFAGMAASFAGLFSRCFAAPFYKLTGFFLNFLRSSAGLFASIPGSNINFTRPSILSVSGYYGALIGGLFYVKRKKFSLNLKWLVVFFLLVLSFVVWFQVGESTLPKNFTVNFLDVGQGDSILIRAPKGETILIDGGESYNCLRNHFIQFGIRKIDLLVLTHPHADHVGGLPEVVRDYNVGMVLDGGQSHTSSLYMDFLSIIEEKGVAYKLARSGQKFLIGDEIQLIILHPQKEFIVGTDSDLNNNSVVIKLRYGEVSFLFTGDIEEEAEKEIILGGKDLSSGILKVPHHGSAGGCYVEFLKNVSPRVAIISAGKGNRYGHPANSTLKKLKELGIKIYRTDRDGTVTITSDGKKVWVEKEK